MKPADARKRLFKTGKPNVRHMTEEDIGVLWAAYRKGALDYIGENLSQEEFTDKIIEILSKSQYAWMIEDRNGGFRNGKGPVGMMVGKFDGWALEPHYLPFPWASARNSLRSVVAFLVKARYEKEIGILNIYSRECDREFFKHLWKRYKVAYYVGKIPRGEYGEDRYEFYSRGGKFYKGMKHELRN